MNMLSLYINIFTPYNTTGLIIILKNMPLSLCNVFLPHRTLDAWCHYLHPVLITWITYLLVSLSLYEIDLKYQKSIFHEYFTFQTNISFLLCSNG